MESSRIFIRGLPPSLSAEDFKKHFSKQSTITDARLIPQRRIGYVGYKSPEDAARAVKYHNKSFIRMSRIGVELARSIETQSALRPTNKLANGGKRQYNEDNEIATQDPGKHGQKKQKQEHQPENGREAKLQEFLEVMKPPSKSKSWENQNGLITHAATGSNDILIKETDLEKQSDGEYEFVPKKRNSKQRTTGEDEETPDTPQDTSNISDVKKIVSVAEKASNNDGQDSIDDVPAAEETQAASDTDWLRSRTSRLLGLVDDEDVFPHTDTPEDERDSKDANSPPREHIEDSGRYVTSIQTNEEAKNAAAAAPELKTIDSGDATLGSERLFIRNLTYSTTERDLRQHFANGGFGTIEEIKRKAEASLSTFNWNSMYMNTDAVMSSISDRLGVSKSELLDPTSSGAAVKQAHAETHVIQETKSYFANHGVDLDAFKRKERGDTAILVKNFPYGTKMEELKQLFEPHGEITLLLMPPSGTTAIIEFDHANHAKSAFGSLAYRKFKDSILFLEKAPKGVFLHEQPGVDVDSVQSTQFKDSKPSATDLLDGDDVHQPVTTSTLFVRNLNFITTTDRLHEVFKPLEGFLSAKVKAKPDPKKQGQILSMGFGFIEFQSRDHAQAALAAMDGYKLDGHELLIRASHKTIDAAEERRKEDYAKKTAGRKTKIIIKNLPFEASKKDVQSLFRAYGQLRSVRVPKKFDSSTRGFAFADFITAREADNAMDALRDTHLLGRRLVLEFAAEDAVDPEQEIQKMQQKVGKQADKVALQRLTGSGRTKFNVAGSGDELDQG
ncbi:multiple RNA-binding domain-containing protein 1, partial [Lecanoromycetidae sp. Uapishka_2]